MKYIFLQYTEKTISLIFRQARQEMKIAKEIRTALSKFPVNAIIQSETEVEAKKAMIGTRVREALMEGVYI